MTVTTESTTTTSTTVAAAQPTAGKAGRFGRVAAITALTLTMAAGTIAAAGTAQAAAVTIRVTQYAACTGGDDTAGLKTAIAALKIGDPLNIPAGVTCNHSDVL